MALLTTQDIGYSGLGPTYGAAATGDTFAPGDGVFVHAKNGSAAAITVTITTPNTVAGLAIADVAVSVPAGGERMIGPFPRQHFGRSADGLAELSYSALTSLTIAAIRLHT